jgi:signal transduction histidine kinase
MAIRTVCGAVLVIVGLGTLFAATDAFGALGQVGVAVIATAGGLGLILGPWVLRLWQQLTDERRERIRSEERADMAAHLHDSVLQTLALIQRTAGSPHETVSLARRQERELRAWLYGDRTETGDLTLASALDAMVSDVESRHAVTIDSVTVGDCPLDASLEPLVQAVREAVVNAAHHSGTTEISVYVELELATVTAYVRDRGCGFDPDAVGPDRRGIAESIIGRMQRHGGTAAIHSTPGEGTEVVLTMVLPEARL